MMPSSKCEFWSSPVDRRTHRIMGLSRHALALRDSGPAMAELGSAGRNGTTVTWSRMAYRRLQGRSPSSVQTWPFPAVSSVNKTSPERSEKRPSCVVNSSVPLSVMTSCRAGSRCHPSFGSAFVSWNDTAAIGNVPLSVSPRGPGSKVDEALLEMRIAVQTAP